ncbi:MAG: hypothetical protein LBE04_05745 [Prevotellaceae bacterium]|nr:hypothetical protein [Prevotellaceae bacterium]
MGRKREGDKTGRDDPQAEISQQGHERLPSRTGRVYRSAYKNALRLVRTEINAAYRCAEWESCQKDPLIKGYKIILSNNHTTLKNGKSVPLSDSDKFHSGKTQHFANLWDGVSKEYMASELEWIGQRGSKFKV